jgi:cell division protein FtsB
VGERGLIRVAQLREELQTASGQNFRLLQSVDRLRRRLHAIRTDDAALERLARQRLRLVRDGETIYRIEPAPRPDSEAKARPPAR